MKKLVVLLLALTLCLALASCDFINNFLHEHEYGEWETKTPATCTDAEVEVRKCSCGAEETRTGDAAVGHNMVSASDSTHHWTACSYNCGTVTEKIDHVAKSIKAVCNKTDYVHGDVALVTDFTVTATCACGTSYVVSDGVVLENATLNNVGANIVTVKLGNLSVNVQVNAEKTSVVLNGTLLEDTYVFSDKKNDVFSERETMGTNSGNFRVYFKFDFSNILSNDYFVANQDDAKVQFVFTIAEGAYTENTTFTFGGFIPGAGVSDVAFSNITWNSVRTGDFTALDWANAIYPIDQAVGSHHVAYDETTLTLTFTYCQVKDFIGTDGIAIFTLRAKESGVKISSMEGAVAPSVKVIVDDSHLHAFNQRIESEEYFISANCGEPTYYFKSCRCGEHGDDFFKTETINEHKFGDWTVVTPVTCTENGLKQRTCSVCDNGVEEEIIMAVGHVAEDSWSHNESYHWNKCANCDEKLNSDVHTGGTATETEQAVCDVCNEPYGGLASHVHSYSAAVTAPTCVDAGYTTYTCDCGSIYVADEVAALGHDMKTKYDDTHHWTECDRNCDYATDAVPHHGGLATTTEQAICEGCGQPYGNLKSDEPIDMIFNGILVEDTYVSSDKKNDSYVGKDAMGTNSSTFRVYFKFDFSEVLANPDFVANQDDAKFQFVFAIVAGAYTENTAFSFGGFIPGAGVSDVAFSNITWNSVRSGNYTQLDWGNAIYLIDLAVGSHHVAYDETALTLTFTYGQIKDFIGTDGSAVFTFRAKESGVKISSMEGAVAPSVKVIVDDTHLHAFDQKIADDKYFISANCGEQTCYYKSCRCGETNGDFFKYGDVNEHDFGDWTVVTHATCTENGEQSRTCTICNAETQTEDIVALGHEAGDKMFYDENNHWNVCVRCPEIMNSTAHFGGAATEEEQAACEACGQSYGALAPHVHSYNAAVTAPTCTDAGYTTYTCRCDDSYVADEVAALGHSFGEWETKTPASCETDEVLIHYCDCGESELGAGKAALGHEAGAEMLCDESYHWNVCVRCPEIMNSTAHFGGTATETEQAVCEACEQPYGGLASHVHSYNTAVTAPTCTDAGYTTYTCGCGSVYVADEVAALGHEAGDKMFYDENNHWNVCVRCPEIMNSTAHFGGAATEEEQAACEACGQSYGALAPHVHSYNAAVTAPTCTDAGYTTYTCRCDDSYVADEVAALGHSFGEWDVVAPAGCETDEVLIHYCDCGENEFGTGAAAFGHDMQTKHDENNHWTECAHNCGKATEVEAHFGGEATTIEQAVCEGCGQSYGELQPEGPKEVTVNGIILDDTYINNSTSNNQSTKPSMGTKSDNFKVYFKYNLSDFLATASEADKANAKVQFSFAITEGSATNSTKVTLKSFTVSDFISGLDFSKDVVTWSNVKSGGDYYALNWGDKGKKLVEETPGENVVVEDGMIYVTVDFSAIEKYIDANGNILIALATNTSGLKIASMENTDYAIPGVKVTYTK